ncbi:hypothetical protein D3C80_919530 [compost metagenome]
MTSSSHCPRCGRMLTQSCRRCLSAMASRALRSRLSSTCSRRMASPRTQAGRGMSRCSSTASLRRRASSSCRARSTTCARSRRSRRPPGLLRAKVFRWPVSAAMRSSCSSRRCNTTAACSSRPCSSSRRRVASCMRWVVSGWLISWASAADICPSAASLADCTRPSWAVRKSRVRASTRRSSSSRLRWRRRARRRRWLMNSRANTRLSQTAAAASAALRPSSLTCGLRSRCRVQPSASSGRLSHRYSVLPSGPCTRIR